MNVNILGSYFENSPNEIESINAEFEGVFFFHSTNKLLKAAYTKVIKTVIKEDKL